MARYTAAGGSFGDVFLNGERQDLVLEADDEHGFIIQYMKDERGKYVTDGDRLATRVLVGKVQFVPHSVSK